MKRTALALAAVMMLLGIANIASAQPVIRLSWDQCDPVVQNKNFTGPGQVAKLVMSATNVSERNNGHRTQVSVGPDVQDAWRYDAGACQLENWSVSHTAVGKSCPALQGTNPLGLRQYSYDVGTGNALIDIANAYDTFVPDPGVRYTVYQANFDHAFSNTGPRDPNLECGFADNPLCFALVGTELLLEGGSSITFVPENDFVTWQDPNNDTGCPGAVPSEESTWGRVKGMYR